ncbi:hypothetical protein NEOLI_003287 [Neolecta irregularis DAH-3]|uniref:BTB domain-containing protein n=1 Tax=Neolecta irregularis (strain DAH-3) TaxID=1198029 RepID=A0A1U7LHE2_NEOID|nr:hypothetical protein NEOLI_003287 [Neolecta irregularis DAH-3]|eukprot:OLL22075.1 hypothetical protein NEOLI_003287 [Neolecta irregularis DAH-3]
MSFTTDLTTDITIRTIGKTFRANSSLLRVASPVFDAMIKFNSRIKSFVSADSTLTNDRNSWNFEKTVKGMDPPYEIDLREVDENALANMLKIIHYQNVEILRLEDLQSLVILVERYSAYNVFKDQIQFLIDAFVTEHPQVVDESLVFLYWSMKTGRQEHFNSLIQNWVFNPTLRRDSSMLSILPIQLRKDIASACSSAKSSIATTCHEIIREAVSKVQDQCAMFVTGELYHLLRKYMIGKDHPDLPKEFIALANCENHYSHSRFCGGCRMDRFIVSEEFLDHTESDFTERSSSSVSVNSVEITSLVREVVAAKISAFVALACSGLKLDKYI